VTLGLHVAANRESDVERSRGVRLLVGPLASVLLGLLSVALLLRFISGVPAIFIGLLCLRRLNALDGAPGLDIVWGRRLAVGGMVLGLLGCLLGVVGLVSLGLIKLDEKSRQANCADNLRKIGEAVNLYHDVNGDVYPGATVDGSDGLGGFAPWLDEPYPKRLGWLVSLLPYIERPQPRQGNKAAESPLEKLAGRFDPRAAWDAPANRDGVNTSVRGFLCPSHPFFDAGHKPAYGYYVGITGLGADAVELPLGAPHAGFFGYVRRLRSGMNLPSPFPRGTSNLMLAAETMLDNGPWAAGDRSTLRGVDSGSQPYIGFERPFGGMHQGGANVLMVDGSVEFTTDRIDPRVVEQMATLRRLGSDKE
jgi:prepilin-type processing-associated H-X9-DG protein